MLWILKRVTGWVLFTGLKVKVFGCGIISFENLEFGSLFRPAVGEAGAGFCFAGEAALRQQPIEQNVIYINN